MIEKIKAEIERRIKKLGISDDDFDVAEALNDIYIFIESLEKEQKAVDFEKEIDIFLYGSDSPKRFSETMQVRDEHTGLRVNDWKCWVNKPEHKMEFARYFYELGLNSKSDAPKIKGWVARDKGAGSCCFYFNKPVRHTISWMDENKDGTYNDDYVFLSDIHLDVEDLRWEDEPIEAELIIKKIWKD